MQFLNELDKKLSKDPNTNTELKAVSNRRREINKLLQPLYKEIKELKQKIKNDPNQKTVSDLLADFAVANKEARKVFKDIRWLKARDLYEWQPQEIEDLKQSNDFLERKITAVPPAPQEASNQGKDKKTPSILKKESSFKSKENPPLNAPSSQSKKVTYPKNPEELDDGGMGEIFREVGEE